MKATKYHHHDYILSHDNDADQIFKAAVEKIEFQEGFTIGSDFI